MTPSTLSFRPLLAGALVVTVFASSGCGWIRSKWGNEGAYQESRQNQPLEVPPGLDLPSTAGAVTIPEAPAGAATTAPGEGVPSDVGGAAAGNVAGIESFTLSDSVESSWRRIGIALGKIEGAVIGDRAQLLNSYEVSYQGVSMLVRAEAVDGQTRVVALGQDGQPIRTGVATQLLALLKARLG
ncbi:hypothetical protein K3217_17720 [bacterium BD-1]|uniref:hypothetical protein n=1 Tax=Arenimonas sp. TaxID=1872635 RepID=UPI001E3B2D34|nr:hypothetical protein [Ottowia caeni]